jgi:hypothetical protein
MLPKTGIDEHKEADDIDKLQIFFRFSGIMGKIRILSTVSEVIEVLGGTAAFAALVKRKSQNVCNYRSDGLPSHTYLRVMAALSEINMTAPASLFHMMPPKKKTRAAA